MTSGEIIFEQGEYKIQFYKNGFGWVMRNGKEEWHKSYHFKLLKGDADFKFFATSIKYPSHSPNEIENTKQEAITVLKKFIV